MNSAPSNCVFNVVQASVAGEREENQDRVRHFDSPLGHVFVLADGMGGHRGGSVAASIATSELSRLLQATPPERPPEEALVESIQRLNTLILSESREGSMDAGRMGSTVAVLLIRETPDGSFAIGAYVGDSRIYFVRHDSLFRLTRDHTVVQRLIDSGAITPEQAATHPQAGVLTRALGQVEDVVVDTTPWMQIETGDLFLLCSDGLCGYATDEDIREAIRGRDSAQAIVGELMSLAERVRSEDNISVLVVRAEAGR